MQADQDVLCHLPGTLKAIAEQAELVRPQFSTHLTGHLGIQHNHQPVRRLDTGRQPLLTRCPDHSTAIVVIARHPVVLRAQAVKIVDQPRVSRFCTLIRQVPGGKDGIHRRPFATCKLDHCLQ